MVTYDNKLTKIGGPKFKSGMKLIGYDHKGLAKAKLYTKSKKKRKNKKITITIEGHADERGTREYNLALGERRANAAKDYLMTYGVSGKRLSVISYGKERPVNPASSPLAWSQNRRSVTIKAN